MKFNTVICGGTFDHFHKGHESFLRYVFSVGEKVIVGVTSDNYVKSDKRQAKSEKLIESFEERKKNVLEFIEKEGVSNRAEVVKIDDLFGPTLDKGLTSNAIVVSENTKSGGDIINKERKKLGLAPLEINIAPYVWAQDHELISSNRIRKGEINREGRIYIKKEWFEKDLKLPEDVREELQKPLGELLVDTQSLSNDENHLIVTVGDITTKVFNEKSLGQNMSVIDFKVARENKFSNIQELGFLGDEKIFNVDNPAGYITSDLFKKIAEIFKGNVGDRIIVQINGEEDLAVLPLILFSPLNTVIYYGQPPLRQGSAGQAGIVKVVVSEESKEKAYNLVLRLKSA